MKKLISLAAVATLLFATGCQSQSADNRDANESSGTISIKLALGAAAFPLLDGLVAIGGGFFEQQGLDVGRPPYIPDAAQGAITAAQGEVDIFEGATPGFYKVLDTGQPIVAIAKGPSTNTVIITVSSSFAAELQSQGITPSSPLADRVKALQGASIATTAAGGSVELLLRSMFRDYGVPEDTQKYPAVSDPAALVGGLRQNQFDALAQSAPTALQPVVDNSGVVFINAANDSVPSWTNVFYMTHSTSKSFAENNPEAIRRYQAAIEQAQELIASGDVGKIESAVKQFFPDLDPSLLRESIKAVAPLFADGPKISQQQYEAGLNQHKNQVKDSTLTNSGNGAYESAVLDSARP